MVLRITINEIKRMICSSGFWLSVGLACIILFTTEAYREQDGTVYTILTAGGYLKGKEGLESNINVQSLFSLTVRYQLPMYGPLLAALSFASILCEEQKYGIRRYLLFKEGKKNYVFSKAVSAMITSGLAFFVSAIILLVFLYVNYPLMSEVVDIESFQSWFTYQSNNKNGTVMLLFRLFGEHGFCMMQLIGVFLYGVFCGFIGYICTAFFANVYLAVCIPFFFGYMYYSIVQAIMGRLTEGTISIELYNKINRYVSPEGYMYFWKMQDSFLINIIVLFGVWIIAIGIHMFRIQKATDCGVNQ
ncbi:MAG: hypothetical protein IKJ01_08455 [Lachnospiraceae bacterium]|nr:hypothetical protein [Lachnospiraceae bacterium]